MKAPIGIAIPPGMRFLNMERWPKQVVGSENTLDPRGLGHWRLWIHTNDRVLGTYLALWDNGKIERVTVREDEGDEVILIKPEDD